LPEHGANNIRDFFRVLFANVGGLTYAAGLPVVRSGVSPTIRQAAHRADGKQGDIELELSRRIVNDMAFTKESRIPDPQRQLMAYRQSAAT